MSFSTAAFANDARLQALEAEVARLKEQQSQKEDAWMNERRAAEVRAIVEEVLADADTRASLMQEGMYAGHNGSKFFLQSADGGFLMEIDGQIMFRHTWNTRDGELTNVGEDADNAGFEVRRAKIQFSGHIADPRIKYALQLSVDHGDNVVEADKIVIGYQLTDSIFIWAGEDKGPFTREEITSSKYQLAAERSYVQEWFTLDKVQGIGMIWYDPSVLNDMVKAHVMINDGMGSGDGGTFVNLWTQEDEFDGNLGDRDTSKDFDEDGADFAITARADIRIAGDWAQMQDFTSFPGEEFAAFVGGAIHWENGTTGDTLLNNDFFMWTIDGSIESQGLSLFASIMGMSTDNESPGEDYDLLGFVIQGAYNIAMGDDSLEPFVRFEYIDFDDSTEDFGLSDEDDLSIVTFGANYYLHRHAAKFTIDLMYAFDPVPLTFQGAGLFADLADEDGQTVLRTQFQLLF